MKKLNLLYVLLFAVTIIACKKDDDETPTFKKEDFYATWQEDGTQGASLIKWDANGFYTGAKAGTITSFSPSMSYTFDGKNTFKITVSVPGTPSVEWKYVIASKTETTFKVTQYVDGLKGPVKSYTKL